MKIIYDFDRILIEFQENITKKNEIWFISYSFARNCLQVSLKYATNIQVWYQLRLPNESRVIRSGYYLMLPSTIVTTWCKEMLSWVFKPDNGQIHNPFFSALSELHRKAL